MLILFGYKQRSYLCTHIQLQTLNAFVDTHIYRVAHERAKRKGQIWRVVDICETTGWPAIPVARITPITCDRLLYPRFSLLKIYPCSPHANIFHLILKFSTRLVFFLHDVNLFIYICLQEYIYNSNIKREKKNKGIELLNFFTYSFFTYSLLIIMDKCFLCNIWGICVINIK